MEMPAGDGFFPFDDLCIHYSTSKTGFQYKRAVSVPLARPRAGWRLVIDGYRRFCYNHGQGVSTFVDPAPVVLLRPGCAAAIAVFYSIAGTAAGVDLVSIRLESDIFPFISGNGFFVFDACNALATPADPAAESEWESYEIH
ncbi:MAG: hypothetical protein PUE41_08370 [bacterium]|nr:hypothetical protein [bacterium]